MAFLLRPGIAGQAHRFRPVACLAASLSADSIQFIIHYRRRWRPGLCLDSAAGNKRSLAHAHARRLRHVLACADAGAHARTHLRTHACWSNRRDAAPMSNIALDTGGSPHPALPPPGKAHRATLDALAVI